jgi:hypothetical protein
MHVQLNKEHSVAKSSSATPTPPDAYERMAIRVQKIINSPTPESQGSLDLPFAGRARG